MNLANIHIAIFNRLISAVFLFVLGFMLLHPSPSISNNLIAGSAKTISNTHREEKISIQKHREIIHAKNKEIAQARDKTTTLVILILLASLSTFIIAILAVFYWKKNRALKFEYSQIKSELYHSSFNENSVSSRSILDEIKNQKTLLNDRQQEILDLLSIGLSNKQIADRLFISENTVKYHIKNIYHLLNVKDRKKLWLTQN